MAAWGPLGEGNATVEGAEPTRYRPDWGGPAGAAASLSATFVSAPRRPARRSCGGTVGGSSRSAGRAA